MADRQATSDNTNTKHAPEKVAIDTTHTLPPDHQLAQHAAESKPTDTTGGGKVKRDGSLAVGDINALYSSASAVPGKGDAPAQTADDKTKKDSVVPPRADEKATIAVADRTSTANSGADAARDIPVRPGDAPATRSNEISYKSDENFGAKEVQAAKDKLTAAENANNMSPELKASMAKHMDDLEHRQPPATAKQIAGVYDAASDLINNNGGKNPPVLNNAERNRLANDVLSNAAQQHEIDQGMHNTCNVTTLEEKLNRENPDKAARLVADVGLKGYYDSPSGKVLLDQNSLHPDSETNFKGTAAKDGDRNYASQVFDMAAINDYWQNHSDTKGLYTQTNARQGQSDTGERLMYQNGQEMRGPDGRPARSPGLGTSAMTEIGKDLGMKGDYLVSTKQFQQDGSGGESGEKRVQSYDEFRNALQNNQTSIIALNAKDQLFTGTENKGGAQGGHVVTVSDFRKGPPEEVYMRNQWGSENNKWVSVADLYNASLPPGSPDRVEPSAVANNPTRSQNDNTGTGGGSNTSGGDGGTPHRSAHDSTGSGTRGSGARESSGSEAHPIVNRDENMMTDDQYKKWQEKIAKDDPNADANKKPKPSVDVDALIAPLRAKLEAAQSQNDDFNASMLQSQINLLDASRQ